MTTPQTPLASLYNRIRWAGKTLGVNEKVFIDNELLPYKIPEVTPPGRIRVDLDDGSYESISATLVLHYNPYTGPDKGGIRLSDKVTTETLLMLAIEMTFKEAVADIEFGGAKMGIRPQRPIFLYSRREIGRIIEAVAAKFIDFDLIGPGKYVPATDLGTTSRHMDIIHNVYASRKKVPDARACVTGKSVESGGLPVRTVATSLGGAVVLDELRHLDALPQLSDIAKPTIIVQGLGQVGGWFVRLISERGYQVIGVSNSEGAVYNPSGIIISEVPATPNESLDHMTGEHISNEKILTQKCDILVPAAIEDRITNINASLIQALVILELANHPVTHQADEILQKRGVIIIPDILANAGGVTASREEYAFGLSAPRHQIDIETIDTEARERIIRVMKDSTAQVLHFAKKYDANLRDAAWLKAMHRIVSFSNHKHSERWPIDQYGA